MKLLSLNCANCAAPLEVPEQAKYITCVHCQSKLAVKQTSSVVYTELLEQIAQKTDAMLRDLAELKYRDALRQLDDQWARTRERFMVTVKDGQKEEPSAGNFVALAVVGGIGACISLSFMFMGAFMGAAIVGGVGGFLIVLVVMVTSIFSYENLRNFEAAKRSYQTRRKNLSVADFLPGDRRAGELPASAKATEVSLTPVDDFAADPSPPRGFPASRAKRR